MLALVVQSFVLFAIAVTLGLVVGATLRPLIYGSGAAPTLSVLGDVLDGLEKVVGGFAEALVPAVPPRPSYVGKSWYDTYRDGGPAA